MALVGGQLNKRTAVLRTLATLALAGVLTLTMPSCSSSDVSTENGGDAVVPPPDAGTDAVPAPAPEQPQAAADPNAVPPPADAPPADPNAVAAPPVAEAGVSAPPVEQAAGAPAPLDPPPSSDVPGGPKTYVTKEGDTLMQIAFENYGDLYKWREIYEKNKDHIADPNHVPPGTSLNLDAPAQAVTIDRNGESYLIRRGDTLGKISKKVYGTRSRWKEIWKNNPQLIKDPNKIYAGFTLYYQPEGGSPQPAPLAQNPAPPPVPATDVREPAAAPPPPAAEPAPAAPAAMDPATAPPPAADAGAPPPPAADLPPPPQQ